MQVSDSNNISLTSSPKRKLHVPIDSVSPPPAFIYLFIFYWRENIQYKQKDPPDNWKTYLLLFSDPAASAISAVQSDWVQAAGNPQLPEWQRGGEQQDEAGQATAI